MKRRMTMPAMLTLALALALSSAAFAQHGDRGGAGGPRASHGPGFGRGDFPPPPGMRPPSPEELERAGVPASQRAKIEALHDEAMRRLIRLGADVRIAELDVRREVEADSPDVNKVEAAIERVGELRTAMHKAHVMEMLSVRALLTPEQRSKLRKLRAPPGSH